MKCIGLLIISLVFPLLMQGQQLTRITPLSKSLLETSGLLYLNQRIITHNDSGGDAALYEIDSTSGNIERIVYVNNATNVDWEDITKDDTYIYIGDFGNNNGTRTDLKIYKILIADYLSYDTLSAEIINFNYSDQTSFVDSPFATNFDAEALISYNDSLYIFSKNWINNKSNVYALTKNPGSYSISKIDQLNSNGLVTGATYNEASNTATLVGYNLIFPFVIELSGFSGGQFSNGSFKRYLIQPQGSVKIESIAPINHYQYYITSEVLGSASANLHRLNTDQVLGLEEVSTSIRNAIFPNPASQFVTIDSKLIITAHFYDMQGRLQLVSNEKTIDVSALSKGLYIVQITSNDDSYVDFEKLVIR